MQNDIRLIVFYLMAEENQFSHHNYSGSKFAVVFVDMKRYCDYSFMGVLLHIIRIHLAR